MRLLRGATTTGILATGRAASTPPADVRYVVTLDADTRLPAGAVARLVGTIAHPLNRPTFDPRRRPGDRRATACSSRGSPRRSRPSTRHRSSSGSSPDRPGSIPYASAVSDVYQDLFGEGSFTGKGIYDLDAFERGDGGPGARERAPEPRPVRGRLRPGRPGHRRRAVRRVPVELPGRGGPPAPLGARRLAAPALDPRPGARCDRPAAAGAPSRASPAGRWSTTCAGRCPRRSPLATLVAAWTLPVGLGRPVDRVRPGVDDRPRGAARPGRAAAAAAGHLQAQPPAGRGRGRRPGRGPRRPRPRVPRAPGVADGRRDRCGRWRGSTSPGGTSSSGRPPRRPRPAGTSTSRGSTGRWRAASRSRPPPRSSSSPRSRARPGSPRRSSSCGCSRPLVARWVSLPPAESAAEQLSAADVGALRLTARRTWRFFETFVGPEDHGLPPDNFQDDPSPVVAHRTSPTNIGMYLLATVTARDFGWIGTLEMVERLEATLATDRQPRAVPRAPLQLVRHARPAAGSSPRTSRRSTAATSPATCSRCPTPAAR